VLSSTTPSRSWCGCLQGNRSLSDDKESTISTSLSKSAIASASKDYQGQLKA
jgi:hypothetical protein